MANPTTAAKGGNINAISVVEDLDILMKFYAIGACPDALFYMIFSPPGCGKTSWMRAHASRESFLINGRMFGENMSAIPIIESPVPTIKEYLAARKAVRAELDDEDKSNETLIAKLVDNKLKSERDVRMRPPKYWELEAFLKNYDRVVYDPKKGNVPIIWVDEATQMSVESRDQLITALVDGELLRELGLKWKPMVVFLANGKAFGGANNFPLSPRQVARCVQMIYVPAGTEDIPVNTIGMNTVGSKKMRRTYHDEVIEDFRSGKNAISAAELPNNRAGNPRTQRILLWFVERVRALKIPGQLEFLKTIINGFVRSDNVLRATEMVREYFTDLPVSLEEIRQIVTGPHDGSDPSTYAQTLRKKYKNIATQEWLTWAKYRSDGTPQGLHDIELFLKLLGVSADITDVVKLD